MKRAIEWIAGDPIFNERRIQLIQADALNHAVKVIQVTMYEGLPLESALALIRVEAGNLNAN